VTSATLLGRRLADLRRERDRARSGDGSGAPLDDEPSRRPRHPVAGPGVLAERGATLARALALAVDGEWIQGDHGGYVRVDREPVDEPVDRERLAGLPGAAPADVPLICLDTETTGLATGTGTVAFLVGIGWWSGERFQQTQFLMSDHAEEPALLDALAAAIPPESWLVTYNGRGFDWPLLVARYRMQRRPAPVHAGHLDLLPFVRRVFRHRMTDARLRTVEAELLGLDRGPDVDGWEIPGRYLDFLRGGAATPLAEVVRHNHEDVRSLARLLGHIEGSLGDGTARRAAPAGDVAGLARAYRRLGRSDEALDCLDLALEARPSTRAPARTWTALLTTRADAPDPRTPTAAHDRETLLVDRARLLRRLDRDDEALATWRDVATGGGSWAGVAWIEAAKILEHRKRDPAAALDACARAAGIAERARFLGQRVPHLEADLARRRRRLLRKVARAAGRPGTTRAGGTVGPPWPPPAVRSRPSLPTATLTASRSPR
jgi:uncharacterized protein